MYTSSKFKDNHISDWENLQRYSTDHLETMGLDIGQVIDFKESM